MKLQSRRPNAVKTKAQWAADILTINTLTKEVEEMQGECARYLKAWKNDVHLPLDNDAATIYATFSDICFQVDELHRGFTDHGNDPMFVPFKISLKPTYFQLVTKFYNLDAQSTKSQHKCIEFAEKGLTYMPEPFFCEPLETVIVPLEDYLVQPAGENAAPVEDNIA